MKRIACLLTIMTASLWAEPAIDKDQLSQTLGHLIVRHLSHSEFELNVDQIVQGIRDEQAGVAAPMSEEEYEQAIVAISQTMFEQTAESNLNAATSFLREKSQETTINVLDPDRLLYTVEKEGMGAAVAEDGMPLIRYHGTLLDGTVFASSAEGDQPIALPLKHTVPGFTKGLVGMKEGEKRTLYIHPELAYGVSGHLPPNSLLIFEVEIVQANAEPMTIAAEGEAISLPRS